VDELLNTLPCGVVSFGDDGIITFANATASDLLGYPVGYLDGERFETLLTVPARIVVQTRLLPMLELHGKASEIFLLLCTRSGSEVGTLVTATRRMRGGEFVNDCVLMEVREWRNYEAELRDARRETQALVATLAARTEELRRALAVADEANHAKARFLTTMSHELRTPLNAIGGYVQLIELGIHGPVTDAQRNALERVNRSQRHLLRLINEILNTARVEAGHVQYMLEDVPVAQIVASVMPMVEPQMIAAGLTLESSVTDGVVVRADREKAQQVLINLLSNAMKFTHRGGRVEIAADYDDARPVVRLMVMDSGIGIPAASVDGIFEPFVQVEVERAHRREGTGLGLAISRDLARAMGGDLTVESEPGVGSTFIFELPRV
jgi:signal transduction histidine kinase